MIRKLSFRNSGVVRRDMRFEYRNRPCYYVEDIDAWSTPWEKAHYSYLYEILDDGRAVAPPSGMRSAVPLGGFGAGTVELRADGSFRDWNIFNNSPAGGGPKVQLDEAFFAIRAQQGDAPAVTKTLRTHPPRFLPGVEQIEYAGAYPVSRLCISDAEIPLNVSLYAASDYQPYEANVSATPGFVIGVLLENPTDQPADVSLLLNLPNYIEGQFQTGDGLTLTSPQNDAATSGTMALRAVGQNVRVSAMADNNLFNIMEHFTATGELFPVVEGQNPIDAGVSEKFYVSKNIILRHGALAAQAIVEPGQTQLVTFVLAWCFPNRTYAGQFVGNHYATLFANADAAVDHLAGRLEKIWNTAAKWQKLCFGNFLPEWLQDAMVNSMATTAKTGLWFADERWRQWESFSCTVMEPTHIHHARLLPYAWFFPNLRRSVMRGYAAAQREDGYIQENLGLSTGTVDQPSGRMNGDTCTLFILEAYLDYLWMTDAAFLDEMWPYVKRAIRWQLGRAEKFGLPEQLNSTYDFWRMAEYDVVAYNAFLHAAAMQAAERLAEVKADTQLADECSAGLARARESIVSLLWTGDYFRAWWMREDSEMIPNKCNFALRWPDAIHADTLYGELWARILQLDPIVDEEMQQKHLAVEVEKNSSPFGLKTIQNTGDSDDDRLSEADPGGAPWAGPRNCLVWDVGSLDWTTLNLFLGRDVDESLTEAKKVIDKWRDHLRDQWDVRDLSTFWDGHPWCNSHYSRHLILWAIPLAISGQQYSAPAGELSFDPRIPAPATLPFFTPSAYGILRLHEDGDAELEVLSGELKLNAPVVLRSTGREVKIHFPE